MTSLASTITCPVCGHQKTETMPTDACQYFYDCEGCQTVLKPKPGDCCVFCSYGDVPCPPMQLARLGGGQESCCATEMPEKTKATKDWVGNAQSFAVAWGFPMGLIIVGLFVDPPARTILWAAALAWMGTACILNARRCRRTHCRFTGPYYLAMILPVLFLGSGAISVGFFGWLTLGAAILVGSRIIWWASERMLGRYS